MRFLTTVLLLLLAVSCRQAARDTIARADMLLSDQPDSALALLEGLDFHRLHGRRLRAHYALTHTVALDKNYIDSDNDSLFRYAFDYYSRHRDDSLRSLAHYYRGRIYQNGTQYRLATESYLTALHHLDTTRSHYRTGLVYSRLGEMYRDQYNFNSALDYFHRALDAYTSARAEVARYMTMLELGRAYHSSTNFTVAQQWLKPALELAQMYRDTITLKACYTDLLYIYHDMGNYPKAEQTYDFILQNFGPTFSALDYLFMASLHINRQDVNLSTHFLEKASSKGVSQNLPFYHLLMMRLAILQKNMEDVNMHHSRYMHTNDSLIRIALTSSIVKAEKDYYTERVRFAEYRNQTRNLLLLLGIFVVIVFFGFLIYYYRSRLRRNESEMYTYMATIQTMQEELALRKKTSPTTPQVHYQSQIRELLAAHFAIMDDLCLAFFEHTTTKEQQRHIFNSVKERLNTLRDNKKGRRQLEKMVNATCNNLIVRLRQQMPQFTDDDIHFILLTCAGFSPQVLSLVFEKTLSQIYARKRRLKDRVRASQVADKEEFLLFLS